MPKLTIDGIKGEGHTICTLGDAAAWPIQGLQAFPPRGRAADQGARRRRNAGGGGVKRLLLCITAASIAISGPVQAQRETGTRIGPEMGRQVDRRDKVAAARSTLDDYARCLVEADPQRVERFLAMAPGDPDYFTKAASVATDRCLSSGELRFKAPLLRAALFERAYRGRFRKLAITAPPLIMPASAFAQLTTVPGQQHAAVLGFADCIVAASLPGAHDLITSNIGTPAEAKAFAALGPVLGPCLPQGVELKFSRSILRGYIAESLYRMTISQIPSRGKSH